MVPIIQNGSSGNVEKYTILHQFIPSLSYKLNICYNLESRWNSHTHTHHQNKKNRASFKYTEIFSKAKAK